MQMRTARAIATPTPADRPLDALELALAALVRSAHANREKRHWHMLQAIQDGTDETEAASQHH